MIIFSLHIRYSNTNSNDKYGKDQRSCSLIMGTYLLFGVTPVKSFCARLEIEEFSGSFLL
jgi:hypothetical protein